MPIICLDSSTILEEIKMVEYKYTFWRKLFRLGPKKVYSDFYWYTVKSVCTGTAKTSDVILSSAGDEFRVIEYKNEWITIKSIRMLPPKKWNEFDGEYIVIQSLFNEP